jgi:hypothetical protein
MWVASPAFPLPAKAGSLYAENSDDRGMISGEKLAELADRRIKASRKELSDALHGRLTDHHRCSGPGSIALSHAGAPLSVLKQDIIGQQNNPDQEPRPLPPAKPSALAGALGRK